MGYFTFLYSLKLFPYVPVIGKVTLCSFIELHSLTGFSVLKRSII